MRVWLVYVLCLWCMEIQSLEFWSDYYRWSDAIQGFKHPYKDTSVNTISASYE